MNLVSGLQWKLQVVFSLVHFHISITTYRAAQFHVRYKTEPVPCSFSLVLKGGKRICTGKHAERINFKLHIWEEEDGINSEVKVALYLS